jgi:hypothetical protein
MSKAASSRHSAAPPNVFALTPARRGADHRGMTIENQTLSSVEIFRAGTHTDSDGKSWHFSDADLLAVASGYAPAQREAPLVVGHPATDAPAWGWVADIRVAPHPGGARLLIDARDVAPAFADMVRERRFPKRSAAFYPPRHPSNPTPGKWYLRHVGFLGATPPALAGLAEIKFSGGDAEGIACFAVPRMEKSVEDDPKDVAALEARLAEQKAALDAAYAECAAARAALANFAEAQRANQHAAHVAFCEAALNEGRLKPADRATAVAVLDALAGLDAVTFSETDPRGEPVNKSVAPLEFVKTLIASAGPHVQFGEHAPPAGASRAAPRDDAELAAAAQKLAREKSIAFADAVKQIHSIGA